MGTFWGWDGRRGLVKMGAGRSSFVLPVDPQDCYLCATRVDPHTISLESQLLPGFLVHYFLHMLFPLLGKRFFSPLVFDTVM